MDQQTSTKLVKICEEVEKLEKELDYWKNRCEFFETKYKELNDLINGGDYDVIVEKKPEIEHVEIKTDSLVKIIQLVSQSPTKIFSVTLNENGYCNPENFLELPNIRKLVVNSCNQEWETLFNSCCFPNIEELWLDFRAEHDDDTKYVLHRNFNAIFLGMKELKHLFVRCDQFTYSDFGTRWKKLESAYINYEEFSISGFLYGSEKTLKSLIMTRIIEIANHERAYEPGFTLTYIYENFKCLERLTVCVNPQYTDNATIPVNNSITFLNIDFYVFEYKFLTERNNYIDKYQTLEKILIATPSLKTLILSEKINSNLIQFIATNMMNLEKLVCLGELEDGVLEEFEEMRKIEADNADVNTRFEVKIKEKQRIELTSYSGIEETYKYYSNNHNSDEEIYFEIINY